MAKRRISTFKLQDELKSKLHKANLKTVEDVLSQSLLQLMILLQLSSSEVKDILSQLSFACLPKCLKAYDLLEIEQLNGIQFGDAKLDQLLQGGIHFGSVTEFVGPPGVGKTQMCFHLVLNCLKRPSRKAVCCIDTEGAFRQERLLEMLQSTPEFDERADHFLANIHILQPKTVTSLNEILDSIEWFCIDRDIGLVVVDSVASLVRKEFSTEGKFERAALLASWAAQFKSLADKLNMAVIVTNQITSKPSLHENSDQNLEEEPEIDERGKYFAMPSLGNTWTHFVNTRFILQFLDSDVRQLIIAKSAVAPIAVKNFEITSAGIQFCGELNYTFSGMNPSNYRIKVQPVQL